MMFLGRRTASVLLAGSLAFSLGACSKSSSSSTAVSSPAAAATSTSASSGASESSSAGAAAVSASPSDPASCKKVRFAVHAGLGGGAVHRYLWKPYKAGTFASGASGRKTAIVKASLAGLFAVHEFKVALTDLQGCPSAQAVTTAVQDGLTKVTGLATGLKSGVVDPKALSGVNDQIASIESQAKSDGINVQEQDPSAVQLATGNTGA
jgi:hypothetical protein